MGHPGQLRIVKAESLKSKKNARHKGRAFLQKRLSLEDSF
jgi:hypothetical protein